MKVLIRSFPCDPMGLVVGGISSAQRRTLRCFLSAVFLSAVATVSTVGDWLADWTLRQPLPTQEGLCQVYFLGDRFLALGKQGSILSSLDGTNWLSSASGYSPPATASPVAGVAFGQGTFVAIGTDLSGNGAFVSTSRDALHWETMTNATMLNSRGIAFGNGRFVAALDIDTNLEKYAWTSPDGLNWTRERATGLS